MRCTGVHWWDFPSQFTLHAPGRQLPPAPCPLPDTSCDVACSGLETQRSAPHCPMTWSPCQRLPAAAPDRPSCCRSPAAAEQHQSLLSCPACKERTMPFASYSHLEASKAKALTSVSNLPSTARNSQLLHPFMLSTLGCEGLPSRPVVQSWQSLPTHLIEMGWTSLSVQESEASKA